MSQKTYTAPLLYAVPRLLDSLKPGSDQTAGKELQNISSLDRLVLVDSTAGVENVKLPLASQSLGVTITIIKISSDGNAVNAVRLGADLINSSGAWAATSKAIGTVQGDSGQFKNDGRSQWYGG